MSVVTSAAMTKNRKTKRSDKVAEVDLGMAADAEISFNNPMTEVDSSISEGQDEDIANMKSTKRPQQVVKMAGESVKKAGESVHTGAAQMVNVMERMTGIDLDRDGDIGVEGKVVQIEPRSRLSGLVTLSMIGTRDTYRITVLKCSELRMMDDIADNDVKVLIRVHGVEKWTETIKDGGSDCQFGKDGKGTVLSFDIPDWSQSMLANISANMDGNQGSGVPASASFKVEVYDEDYGEADDLIGECVVPYSDIPYETASEPKDYKLIDESFDVNSFFKKLDEQANFARNLAGQVPFLMEFLLFAMDPNNTMKLIWDFWILMLVFYSSFSVPYETAFWKSEPDATILRDSVEVFFWLDIVVTFWTGYDKGFEVIMHKGQIVRHYLSGWFLIDFVATMDWSALTAWVEGTSDEPSIFVRMLRLIKVLRLARAGRIIKRITATWTLHTRYIDAVNFFMYVVVVCHLLACLFYLYPILTICSRDQAVADAAFANPSYETVGWVWGDDDNLEDGDTCLQNSWRQHYGLETICKPCQDHSPINNNRGNAYQHGTYNGLWDRIINGDKTTCESLWDQAPAAGSFEPEEDTYILRVCQETAERGLHVAGPRHDGWYPWSARIMDVPLAERMADSRYNLTANPGHEHGSFQARMCPKCMRPKRLWFDALYWSLTTMTTIGYGDRGPQTEGEIIFVMFSEVFGLAFFAILLTQINTVNDVMSETSQELNDQKNNVVQFLKHHELHPDLINEAVRFLNFRATALSGNAFDEDSDKFRVLSPGIKRKIKQEMNRPMLEKVRIFGWNPIDAEEESSLRKVFDDIDHEKTGELSRDEMRMLFEKLNLELSDKQFEKMYAQLDYRKTGSISYTEFKHWWYKKKDGMPHMDRCPEEFLNVMAHKLQSRAFDKDEIVVAHGEYGQKFGIILDGTVTLWRDRDQQNDALKTKLEDGDRESVFGFMSVLKSDQFKQIQRQTKDWNVRAETYLDLAWLSREDMIWCFKEAWPDGYEEMVSVAFSHYEITEELAMTLGHYDPSETDGMTSAEVELLSEMKLLSQVEEELFDTEKAIQKTEEKILEEIAEIHKVHAAGQQHDEDARAKLQRENIELKRNVTAMANDIDEIKRMLKKLTQP